MSLPCLLYLGDVPVEASYHGSALLYRLLQDYPPERLLIIEGNLRTSLLHRRLPRVLYSSLWIGWRRAIYSRLNPWAQFAYSLGAAWRVRALERALGDFVPQAVITVAHDFLWLTASGYSQRRAVPLHFILHDDWPRMASFPEPFRPWLEREFRRVYRQAASRLCVSPYMEECYRARYGVPGSVVYPCRARQAQVYTAPPDRLGQSTPGLTGLYGGSIGSPTVVRALQTLSQALEVVNGKLLVYCPLSQSETSLVGLDRPNIEWRGLVASPDLIAAARKEADFLFVPMSFEPVDLPAAEVSFPSKLTDYTATGLPLLIMGPPSCSAVRWASDHPGSAEVVRTNSVSELASALQRLRDPAKRMTLAETAIRLGEVFFSHTKVQDQFLRHLTCAK